MEIKKYEIAGKTYVHPAQVLGQLKQLEQLLEGVRFSGNLDIITVIKILGDKLPQALAIVLVEEGKLPKDKDLDALAVDVEQYLTLEQIMEIVDGFFSLNPLSSVIEKIVAMMGHFMESVAQLRTGSPESASLSVTETLQNVTESSGQ